MKASVVIPVYNDPAGLNTTMESLIDQTSDNYEVLICDNGSTDKTVDVASSYADRDNVSHIVEDEIQGSYAARNAGIEASSGEAIGFLDADTWVEPGYVEKITDRVLNEGRRYIGCRVEVVGNDSLISRFNQATGFPVEKYVKESGFAPTNCLVVHEDVIDTVGKFDQRLVSSGDVVFGRQAQKAGIELVYEPDIVVYHPARSTLKEHVSKAVRIGRGREQIRRYGSNKDVGRSILHPRNYLPPDPVYFLEKLEPTDASKTEILIWYLLSWLLNWCTTYGRISERAKRFYGIQNQQRDPNSV